METLSISSRFNKTVREQYMKLPQGESCMVTYIWIDGTGTELRSKTKTLDREPKDIEGNYNSLHPIYPSNFTNCTRL